MRTPPDQAYLQAADLYRPTGAELSAAIKRLAESGLTDRDISTCLRMDVGDVRDLLAGAAASSAPGDAQQ